ncbi:MAG: protease inhibitor I42 family protein [bacterium]
MWEKSRLCCQMLIIILSILAHITCLPLPLQAQFSTLPYYGQDYYTSSPSSQISPLSMQYIFNAYYPRLYNPPLFPFQNNPYQYNSSGLTSSNGVPYISFPSSTTPSPYSFYNNWNTYALDTYNQNPYIPNFNIQNFFTPPAPSQPSDQFIYTDVSLDETYSGQTIHLAEGETLSIILTSNATTGYKWNLDINKLDSDILEKLEDIYYQSALGYLGIGGYEQWIFKAEDRGTTFIELEYTKIFDSSAEAPTFELEVVVY